MIRLRSNYVSLKLLAMLILALSLAACGGGGGSDSGGTTSGSGEVKSYEAYTGSDGIASFTLTDGNVDTVKVSDKSTGVPIEGIKVILTTNNTEAFYFLIDENNLYAPEMESYQLDNPLSNALFYFAKEFVLGEWSELKNLWSNTTVPRVTTDRLVDAALIDYFKNNVAKYHRTTTVSGISGVLDGLALGADMVVGGIISPTVVGAVFSGITLATSLQETGMYLGWEATLKSANCKSDDIVDIYKVGDFIIGSVGIIVVPRNPCPGFQLIQSISGQVLDLQGNPIPNATIFIHPKPTDSRNPVSDNSGYFNADVSISSSDSTDFILHIEAPGYFNKDKTFTIYPSGSSVSNFSITLKPRTTKGTIEITVKDSVTQNPLSKAKVKVFDSSNNSFFPTLTATDGRYTFEKEPGRYKLFISKTGYISQEVGVDVSTGTTVYPTVLLAPSPETTLPDLTISSASVGSNYTAGQTNIQIPVTVSRSGGNLTFGTSVLARLYWSTNSIWDFYDVPLWGSNNSTPDYPISNLNSYGSETITASIGIPSVSSSGTYYLIMVVDPYSYHLESIKTNNFAIFPISVTASSTPVNAPTVTTATYQVISSSSAQLLGTVNSNGLPTTGWFEWGATTSYGNTTGAEPLGSGTSAVQMLHTISGLASNTTYYFKAVGQNSAGTSYGAEMTFTTPPPATVSPTVTTGAATSVSSTSATLNGTVNPNGALVTAWFEWGSTMSYVNTTPTFSGGIGTSTVPMSWPLSGLSPNTTYYFRAVAQNSAGTSYGTNRTFTTYSGCTPPGSFTLSANAYCNTTAPTAPAIMLNWASSSGATSYEVYRNNGIYFSGITGTNFDNNDNVVAGQTYTYYVLARNSCNVSQSNTVVVTVPSDTCSTYLSAPILTSPPNGGPNQLTTPAFIWSAVTGASSYRIMVSTNPAVLPSDPTSATCSGCVINYTTTYAYYITSAGILNTGTTYYWQVHARSSSNYGLWSGKWSFTTY